jgi:hypothetical protein
MRRCLFLLVCMSLTYPLFAEDNAKPNTLTPKEIADGWVLLFDGETSFGWAFEGESKVQDGWLVLEGTKRTVATLPSFPGRAVLLSEIEGEGMHTFGSEHTSGGHSVRKQTVSKFAIEPGKLRNHISYRDGKNSDDWVRLEGSVEYDSWVPLRITFATAEKSMLRVRNIKLQPIGLKPIFNSSDLSGWKVHPGRKSKFSVTPEGWLHIKDGPGDLQTEALFDDFILQLECKTNGKQLNSGVFFRCRPGEYQQGYEAQIHNGFDVDKPKEYIVEEYDPKTNELKDKKKTPSPATDYGTGAIYRRVPARKQAAKDGEWFTMTVVAHGRHIATWVNGIQMVDWTDNRPLKDNARNGCRLEKGAISLQGHDPTTDLVFRNIRIAELPRNVVQK